MEGNDFLFLDAIEKSPREARGHGGNNKEKRRPSRKIYSDIKYLCKYIELKGREAGINIDDRSLHNIRKTFVAAEKEIRGPGKRRSQLEWGEQLFGRLGRKSKAAVTTLQADDLVA